MTTTPSLPADTHFFGALLKHLRRRAGMTQRDLAAALGYSDSLIKAEELLEILRQNPCQNPPPYEKLVGDLAGACSRRINIQHRLVYQVGSRTDRQSAAPIESLRVVFTARGR